MGGGIVSNTSALPVLRSAPRAGNRWTFGFDNRGGGSEATVRVRITCVKVPPPGKRRWSTIGMEIRRGKVVLVIRPLRLGVPRCRKRKKITSLGFEFPESRQKQAAWASTRPTGFPVEVSGSWVAKSKGGERGQFTVTSLGTPVEVRVSAVCVAPAATSGRMTGRGRGPATHRHPIRISHPSITGTIAPGFGEPFRALCPKDHLSIGTGFLFPPGEGLSLFRSYPIGGRASLFEIDNPAPDSVQVQIQAACLDARPGWRSRR